MMLGVSHHHFYKVDPVFNGAEEKETKLKAASLVCD